MTAKSLEKLLKSDPAGGLGDVVRRAREMGELATALSQRLPADLADGIVAANVRDDGELIVICRSSEWASRLRFEQDKLISIACDSGATVSSCSVRVSQSA